LGDDQEHVADDREPAADDHEMVADHVPDVEDRAHRPWGLVLSALRIPDTPASFDGQANPSADTPASNKAFLLHCTGKLQACYNQDSHKW
jgi:hypothetical protein